MKQHLPRTFVDVFDVSNETRVHVLLAVRVVREEVDPALALHNVRVSKHGDTLEVLRKVFLDYFRPGVNEELFGFLPDALHVGRDGFAEVPCWGLGVEEGAL